MDARDTTITEEFQIVDETGALLKLVHVNSGLEGYMSKDFIVEIEGIELPKTPSRWFSDAQLVGEMAGEVYSIEIFEWAFEESVFADKYSSSEDDNE